MKTVINFFKELFRDDIGIYDPNAKKWGVGWVIYWIVGSILSILIPICLVYLEAWEFQWNVFRLIWVEEGTNYLCRLGYFCLGIPTNFLFLGAGYATTKHINGKKEYLETKKTARTVMYFSYGLCIFFFIMANIMY